MTVSGDPMANDGYRTENNISISSEGSSSKDNLNLNININQEEDGGWLRLSLGRGSPSPSPSPNHQISLPGSTSNAGHETWSLTLTTPHHQHQHQHQQQQQQLGFQVTDFRSITTPPPMFILQPHPGGVAATIDSVSAHHQQYDNNYLPLTTLSSPSSLGRPPLRIDFRVVDPPPRPYSGVWFILQASQTQTKEPYLPQVPKSYLRIKDGRTTVGLLIKYLVYKLNLDGEFEIEIRCKGEQLLPFLSLQHVRDNIWNRPRKDVMFINASTTSMDHLMVLHYGRPA